MVNYMDTRNKVRELREIVARLLVNNVSLKSLDCVKNMLKDLEQTQMRLHKLAEELIKDGQSLYSDEDVAKLGCKVIRVKDGVYSVAFYSMDNEEDWHFICLCFRGEDGLMVYKECADEDSTFWKVSPFVAELVNNCVLEYIEEREMFEERGVMR